MRGQQSQQEVLHLPWQKGEKREGGGKISTRQNFGGGVGRPLGLGLGPFQYCRPGLVESLDIYGVNNIRE